MDSGDEPGAMKEKVGEGGLRYSPKYGDLAPGRVGNGTHEYDVPLANGAFRGGALLVENLASSSEGKQTPAVHAQNPAEPGVLVIRMPSSYVYLGGEVAMEAIASNSGAVEVLFSENNGLDWKPLAKITSFGSQRIDLKPHVFRRYNYQLKFVLTGNGSGIDKLKITHPIQHSQRPLPALAAGENKITFNSDDEGTVTIEGSMEAKNKEKQLVYTDFHPQRTNIGDEAANLTAGSGEITFPISTPGDMKRLRIGAYYRARDPRDVWEVQVSFDGAKSFKTVERLEGPFIGMGKSVVVSDIPAGTRSAHVRFAGTQRNTLMLQNARIDADYKEPNGGFRPVQITYAWEENGESKQNTHIVRRPEESYTITCTDKPLMKSIALELAE
jgi:hypothetical protein